MDNENEKKEYEEVEQIQEQIKVKAEVKEEEEEGPPPGYQTILLSVPKPEPDSDTLPSTQQQQKPTLTPTIAPLAQLVCGSCRSLLNYPLGATQVQCSYCLIVNFVLQGSNRSFGCFDSSVHNCTSKVYCLSHQVGQVKCGSCAVLLMYPYGAPQVRCSSCQFVTEIGGHNQRPPWSVQQGQPLPCPNPSQ